MTAVATCPGCGRADRARVFAGDDYYRARCVCGWCAPTASCEAAARAVWNFRAPALRWRREPPDVPGWWWLVSRADSTPRVAHYAQRDCDDLAACGDSSSGWRWAGPIPEPEEAE